MTHTQNTHRDPETLTLALALVRVALFLDPETGRDPQDPDRDPLTLDQIPEDSTFTLRRDVEYLASEVCHPDYAAPRGTEDLVWERTGDEEVIESDWSGPDQMVRAYRWDLFSVTLEDLETLADLNLWDPDSGDVEPLAGYLTDSSGLPRLHPACSIVSDGMDWNQGGWSPVYIVSDYVVLD